MALIPWHNQDFLAKEVKESQSSDEIKQRTQKALEESKRIFRSSESIGIQKEQLKKEYEEVRLSTIASLRKLRHETGSSLEEFRKELSWEDSETLSDGSMSESEVKIIEDEVQDLRDIHMGENWEKNKEFSKYSDHDIATMDAKIASEYLSYLESSGQSQKIIWAYRKIDVALMGAPKILQALLSSEFQKWLQSNETIIDVIANEHHDNFSRENIGIIISGIQEKNFPENEYHTMLRKVFKNIEGSPDIIESIIQDKKIQPKDLIKTLPQEYIEDRAFLEKYFPKELIESAQKQIKTLQSKVSKIVKEIEKYGSGKLWKKEAEIVNSYILYADVKELDYQVKVIIDGNIWNFWLLTTLHNNADLSAYAIEKHGYSLVKNIHANTLNDTRIHNAISRLGKNEYIKFINEYGNNYNDPKTRWHTLKMMKNLGIKISELKTDSVFRDTTKLRALQKNSKSAKKYRAEQKLQQETENNNQDTEKNTNIEQEIQKEWSYKETKDELQQAGFSSEEISKITPEEQDIISESKEALRNFIDFRKALTVLNLEEFWDYRERIFTGIQSTSVSSGFDMSDSDYVSPNELSLFLYTILDSINEELPEAQKNEIESLRGEKQNLKLIVPLMRRINKWDNLLANTNDVSILRNESYIGSIFRQTFVWENEKLASWFQIGKFLDRLGK